MCLVFERGNISGENIHTEGASNLLLARVEHKMKLICTIFFKQIDESKSVIHSCRK